MLGQMEVPGGGTQQGGSSRGDPGHQKHSCCQADQGVGGDVQGRGTDANANKRIDKR
jgi:hypothetical protein